MLFLGIDLGRTGVSSVVADEHGNVYSLQFCCYSTENETGKNNDSSLWWNTVKKVISCVIKEIYAAGFSPDSILALSVSSVSGSVFPVDEKCISVDDEITDGECNLSEDVMFLNYVGKDYTDRLGIRVNDSYGLVKILSYKKNHGDKYDIAASFIHPGDYIVFRLTGEPCVTDSASALKFGYDILGNCYGEILNNAGLDAEKFPSVYTPGTVMGKISGVAAEETGLSRDTFVCIGATDGYAAGICSGAVEPGQWATILGTNFVIRGVTEKIVKDEAGRIYCHKHPEGYYMPTGMSNVGGKCLIDEFGAENLHTFDASVLGLIPTKILVYPLSGTGERFPFINEYAKRFIFGYGGQKEMYTAYLEGLSYVEKLSFEIMERLGCIIGDEVYAVGGSTRGREWLKIRATVLNKFLHVPKNTLPAMGCCMIAASGTYYRSITESVRNMLQIDFTVSPYQAFSAAYERLYLEFKDKCAALFAVDL